jgi:S1-C subfamily serine protease
VSHGTEFTASTIGETYELNAAASAGNSGGPVFDQQGRVIGLLTYTTRRESTTYAGPIRFGYALMN